MKLVKKQQLLSVVGKGRGSLVIFFVVWTVFSSCSDMIGVGMLAILTPFLVGILTCPLGAQSSVMFFGSRPTSKIPVHVLGSQRRQEHQEFC